ESAVLPITPYPMDLLLPAGKSAEKDFSKGFPEVHKRAAQSLFFGDLAGCAQACEALIAPQDLHRLEQRRAHLRTGDRHPHRTERLARFEAQIVHQRLG